MKINISLKETFINGYKNIQYINENKIINTIPIEDESIDFILCNNLLEYIDQGSGLNLFRECRRILRYGGELTISTIDLDKIIDNYYNNNIALHNEDDFTPDNNSEYINILINSNKLRWIYNSKELKHAAELTGLKVTESFNDSTNNIITIFKKINKNINIKNPLVSILIPAFGTEFIEESINSAINQTYENTEIIICDDREDLQIQSIIEKSFYNNKNLKYFHNKKNIGGRLNYLNCFQNSKGEFIKFLNDDDILEPNCVERMVDYFIQFPNITLATSHRQVIDKNGSHLPDILPTKRIVPETAILEGRSLANFILQTGVNFIGEPTTVLFRKADAIDIKPNFLSFGGFEARGIGDIGLFLNLLSKGDAIYITDTLSYFRLHKNQAQRQDWVIKAGIDSWKGVRKHGARLGYLLPHQSDCLKYRLPSSSSWATSPLNDTSQTSQQLQSLTTGALAEQYTTWHEAHQITRADVAFYQELLNKEQHLPVFHLILLIDKNSENSLADIVDSIGNQIYQNWIFSIIADYDCPNDIFNEIEQLQWVCTKNNSHDYLEEIISDDRAEWVGIIKPGIVIEPTLLLYSYLYISKNSEKIAIYYDSDEVDDKGKFKNYQFRPDFNFDLFISTNYIGVFCLFKKIKGIEQYLAKFKNAYNYYTIITQYIFNKEESIGHVDSILYHTNKSVLNINIVETFNEEKSILCYFFERTKIKVKISEGLLEHTNFVQYNHDSTPLVSIIIPTKNNVALIKNCVSSLFSKTAYKNFEILIIDNQSTDPQTLVYLDTIAVSHPNIRVLKYARPFNFSAMNNYAAHEAKGEYLLLLNDDTEIIQDAWLERMLQHAQREDVGAVGARLVYRDKKLQHAGVILGIGTLADHPGIGQDMLSNGYMNRFQVVQNFSAVTAACLLVKKSKYLEVGGMDENKLKVLYNDVDFCLKLGQAGYRNVWTPYATVIHHGSSSLGVKKSQEEIKKSNQRAANERHVMEERWLPLLANDPCYNRNLSLRNRNWGIEATYMVPWSVGFHDRLRVAALPNSSAGSKHYRISAPLAELRKNGRAWNAVFPDPSQNPANTFPSTIELERLQPDTLLVHSVFPKTDVLQQYKKLTKVFLVFGMDDLLSQVPKYNPTSKTVPKDIASIIKRILNECDRLIVSTEPLYTFYKKKKLIDDIVLIPNAIDNTLWSGLASKKRQGGKPRVGWAGASQHHGDLHCILDVVRDTSESVDWIFLGMCPEEIRKYVREFYPAEPLENYPAKLASLNLDLAVAPLETNPFNEAKSNLRLLEYGILGVPVIASDIFPYQNSPVKLVDNTYSGWTEAIRERIHDLDAAEREGLALQRWVNENFLIEQHLSKWFSALSPG
jgi:GT2 family glycosyltransferase